jgi:hypothetical protein
LPLPGAVNEQPAGHVVLYVQKEMTTMNVRAMPLLRRANQGSRSRWLRALAFVLCAATMGFAYAQDDLPGRVGRVADVGGELFLAPQDKPDGWGAIGLNYPVTNGDNLWVGNNGRAEIDFGGGQFRLAADTNLHVSRLDDRQFALFVAQGRVSLRVRVLDPGESARIDTPNAQIAITRPGLYRVDVSQDREHSHLIVREGEANVLTAGAVQQVLPGQSADVDGTDPQFADVRNGAGLDGFDTWVADRDRFYARRTPSYVSPQMVGAADLDRYGSWSQAPEYGAVWYPSDVPADWAPYRNGYWADVGTWGPTWVDYAPWGYAPFHYGRWVYVGNRWGWCPGRYIARPLWAPALVAWTGGAGWGISATVGAPVYGWVPLAWGEPYRPWWGRCSYGCWDRYNRPYAVNVAVVRPNSPAPTYYRNWNAPGGVTAVSSSAFMARQPVQQNMVRVPREMIATAPVMTSAPTIRHDAARVDIQRPVNAPPPASAFQPAFARQSTQPANTAIMPRGTPQTDVNAARSRPSAPVAAQPSTGMVRQAPTATQPSTVTSAPPPQPFARETPSRGVPPTASNAPVMRQAQPMPQATAQQPMARDDNRSANRTPPPPQANAMPQQYNAPREPNATRSSRPQYVPPPAPSAQVQQPQAAPMVRAAPQPVPQPRVAPAPVPQQHAAPPPPAPQGQAHGQGQGEGRGDGNRGRDSQGQGNMDRAPR